MGVFSTAHDFCLGSLVSELLTTITDTDYVLFNLVSQVAGRERESVYCLESVWTLPGAAPPQPNSVWVSHL